MKDPLLEVRDLKTYFYINKYTVAKKYRVQSGDVKDKLTVKALDGVSFNLYKSEALAIVGESGSGKSVTANSILGLIPKQSGRIVSGEIIFKGKDISKFDNDEYRKIRGREISMIFQEPMSSLNPVMKIGSQLMEVFKEHSGVSKPEAYKLCVEMLRKTGISDAEKRMNSYPHEFSGGMRQRVMIAMALLFEPSVLIADEPTTALDVTIQKDILELIKKIKESNKESGIILITHNLGIVYDLCDRVLVMYGGKVQEEASTGEIFSNPLHPYTRGLLKSLPDPYNKSKEELFSIKGSVPTLLELPEGCRFCTRCEKAFEKCSTEPPLKEISPGHFVRCRLY